MSDQSDVFLSLMRAKGIIADSPAAQLPYVLLPRQGATLLEFAKQVGAIVGANGVFRRELAPVTINPETGRIEGISPDRWRTYCDRHLISCVERFGMKQPTTMSVSEARGVLASDDFRFPLRKLTRVHQVRLPVMRADGRIELLPKGYDAESNFFTLKDAIDYDEDWTFERARLHFDYLLREFPFADTRDRAAHIAAILTMFAGGILPTGSKPLNFVYRSNRPRAGKGLLIATAVCPSWGPVNVQAIPNTNDELRKILDTEALNGSPYILFDEVERRLENRYLNSFMTARFWVGRLLGTQEKFGVPQESVIFLAGNGVDLSSDLAGRCLLVDLWVAEADAQARNIKHEFSEAWLCSPHVRADLLAATWALVRAWDQAKRPPGSFTYRGFEEFSRTIGGVVEFAGFGSPMKSNAADADPDYADMLAIIEHLVQERLGQMRRGEFDFEELIETARELHAFEWHLVNNGSRDRFELTAAKKSWFGKLFSSRYGGATFTLFDKRRVKFGHKGKNRQRRYVVEVI